VALNGIDTLAQFGGEQAVLSAQAVKISTLKEIEESIRKVVNKMDNIPQLSVSDPRQNETIKSMEEISDLVTLFSKLSCFKDDPNIAKLVNINIRNENNLMHSLTAV